MLLDLIKAFLCADIERELFIELPDDDERRSGPAALGLRGFLGLLKGVETPSSFKESDQRE